MFDHSDHTHLGPNVCYTCGDFSADCYLPSAWQCVCDRCQSVSYVNDEESVCSNCGYDIAIEVDGGPMCADCLSVQWKAA